MAAAQGDLVQAIDVQSYLGEELLNIYYFRVVPITGLSDPYLDVVADHVQNTIISAVRTVQSPRLVHTGIQVRNLSNNLDYLDRTINIAGSTGATTSQDTPSFYTLNIQLVRESLATRNGRKGIGGIPDSGFDGNTVLYTSGTINPILAAMAADVLVSPSPIILLEPVIVGRPFTAPVAPGYRYASIGSARLMGMGTQNTRKAGRGS